MAVGCDLLLMWLFWPSIPQLDQPLPEQDGARQPMLRAERVLYAVYHVGVEQRAALLMVVFATCPGEGIDTLLWKSSRFTLPRPLVAVREFLVAGQVNPASRTPRSLWSNRLVLPGLDVIEHMKLDTEANLEFLSETASLRQRNLDGAVLIGAVLRKGDFTGASLRDAQLAEADLRQAKLACAIPLREGKAERKESQPICTNLAGASLEAAQLQGASLVGAQLQGASLTAPSSRARRSARRSSRVPRSLGAAPGRVARRAAAPGRLARRGAAPGRVAQRRAAPGRSSAHLQGASLDSRSSQGASLAHAQLQGASLHHAQLQGASLVGAQLQGASLDHQGSRAPRSTRRAPGGAARPHARGLCPYAITAILQSTTDGSKKDRPA